MAGSENPAANALRERAAEILARPEYRLDSGRSGDDGWIFSLFLEIVEWLLIPFRILFDWTEGLPDFLRWIIVIGMAVVLLLLIGHIVYSLVMAIRDPKRVPSSPLAERRRSVEPEELERLASDAAARNDYVSAIRLLFRASVVRLERHEKKANRPGTTNRELLRRYRNRSELKEALEQIVDTIDRKWYGDEVCSSTDYQSCQRAHEDICRFIGGRLHALST